MGTDGYGGGGAGGLVCSTRLSATVAGAGAFDAAPDDPYEFL